MTIEIKMPALSPTMESGTLAKWLVKEGDGVEPGQAIAEIETDKATMEVEAADEGAVGKLVVAEGTENVPVGAVIAVLLEEGEGKADLKTAPKAVEKKIEAVPAPQAEPKKESSAAPTPPARREGERIKASPLARRLARERGVELSGVTGSGPGGRIVKADLEGGKARPTAAFTPGAPLALDPPKTEIRVSNVRKITARRLTEAKQTIPHYYLTLEANITELLKVRKQINGEFQQNRVSLNDFIIKACALALMKTPDAHVQWLDGKMFRFERADISVAVAIPGGLVTPIIRGADAKPLRAIAAEMRVLADKAKAGKLAPQEYQGGTFSISNLGMYGIKHFIAVINPPQSGILAVGAGEERPVLLKDGKLENQTFMAMTGSFDHRAVDGATGAKLMAAIKDVLEHPAVLLY